MIQVKKGQRGERLRKLETRMTKLGEHERQFEYKDLQIEDLLALVCSKDLINVIKLEDRLNDDERERERERERNANKEAEDEKDGWLSDGSLYCQGDEDSGAEEEGGAFEGNWDHDVASFEEMNLKEDLLRGILGHGFESPSPIQRRAILPIVKKHDTIAQAQAGTGKTGAFLIAALQILDAKRPDCQVLVLAPSRPLAVQIYGLCAALSAHMPVRCRLCVGGASRDADAWDVQQATELATEGAQMVVGTLGQVNVMLDCGALVADKLKLLVLDEADQLLSEQEQAPDGRAYKEGVYDCFQSLPRDVQVALFCTTMPRPVFQVTKKFMREPATVAEKAGLLPRGVGQYRVDVGEERYKLDTLFEVFAESERLRPALVYCNGEKKARWLTDHLRRQGFNVACFLRDLTRARRDEVVNDFRDGATDVLVSTDLLCRGVELGNVAVVCNYDVPLSKEDYVHRVGRSGRYGRKGMAMTFVTDEDEDDVAEIDEFCQTRLEDLPENLDKLMPSN